MSVLFTSPLAQEDDVVQEKSPNHHVEIEPSDPIVEMGEMGFQRDARLDRKVVLKLDLLLLPVMCTIFVLLFLDRANIGNARVAGLQKDLHLTGRQYQIALTVTYIPYILVELPSNLLLKRIGPRTMLPGLCILWGTVTTFQSLMSSYGGLLACRFFLGLCEGGLFPGFVLYLSDFYRRHELQTRIGLIYGAASLSGAFSGLLAAAIEKMNGIGGLKGYKWIFLLEGGFTVVFGMCSLWLLPNTPQQVLSFTPGQAAYCTARLNADSKSIKSHKITANAVLSSFKEPHVIIIAIISFCNGTCITGLAYFTPSIVQALGYSTTKTQLLTVPPFALALVATMIAATFADRYQRRGLVAFCSLVLGIVGCALNLTGTSIAVRYTALCFLVTSTYSTSPSILTWIPNNSATYSRRATAVAIGFVASNSGGIISTWIYPQKSAPRFLFGTRFNLSLICIEMALITVQVALLKYLNQKKVDRRDELLRGVEHLSLNEQMEVLGDHHPDFRYTL